MIRIIQYDPLVAEWPASRKRGFALVITLTLMILLTILAVGLLTLSSISLRASNQGQAQRIARENARMALVLAIGELQKYAGQDQRITATADIAGTVDGLPLATDAEPRNDKSINGAKSKGLSAVQPGTRYWTGVFTNRDTPATIYYQTPSPTIVHWLVSGNDTTWPTGGPTILPSDDTYAVSPNGAVRDAAKAVVLVGRNSVGNSSGSADRYVVVPLVDVLAKDKEARGKAAPAKPVARFAWWVGDEGVKAKINLDQTFVDKTNYASLAAQRRGWETVDGFKTYPTPGEGAHTSLPKLITLGETPLLVPGAKAVGEGSSPLQNVFHAATSDSRAVLSDTLRGGTKVDLSTILAGTLPGSSAVATIDNYPVKGRNIIPSINKTNCDTTKLIAPKWDAIKEFSDRGQSLDGGTLIVKAAATDNAAAIAPLITDFRILMGAQVKSPATDSFTISACGKIAVALANPYSRTLKWKDDIEIELRNQTPPGNSPSRIWNIGGKTVYIQRDASEAAVFNNAFFRIKSASLAPGEARGYTVAGPVKRAEGTATQRVVIELVPIESTVAGNFNNCVELENSETRGNIPGMDVRESWQTTLALIEMRMGGALLRRVERLELDNGYFGANTRNLTNAEATQCTGGPVGLMLYIFQLSQPGGNYVHDGFLPSTYDMGQRNSTLRTFADFNLQATHVRKPITSYAPPPYFMFSTNGLGQLGTVPPGGDTGGLFTANLPSPCRWGRSANSGSDRTILFSVPSQLASLAQLQHADLTGDDLQASIGHQPGNAVGNSYATPFVKRGQLSQTRTDYEIVGSPNSTAANTTRVNYYDICYLLNASLWDSYFFSTIPRTGSANPENPTLVRIGGDASGRPKDPLTAATSLMIDGAFNCNSTNINAWKAFLASTKHFKHAADSAANAEAAFPRTLEQTSKSASPPTGNDADSFSGYRRLTDAQLDALATEIVKQVRIRGPFVSLSHFVNRALTDLKSQPALTRCGALQSAIDASGANISFDGKKNAFSGIDPKFDMVTLLEKQGAPRADFDGTDTGGQIPNYDPSTPDWAVTSTDNNFGAVASILADREMFKDTTYKPEQGYRSTGIPGWLTQADVLQVIGPALTTRSDTFRIRAYGEALDPNGNTTAKAYCEAIVQRVPAYIDPADLPSARGAELTTLNTTYGRQFEIVAFRWLSPNEI